MSTLSSNQAFSNSGEIREKHKTMVVKTLYKHGPLNCYEVEALINSTWHKATNVRSVSATLSQLWFDGFVDIVDHRPGPNKKFNSAVYKLREFQLDREGCILRKLEHKRKLLLNTQKEVDQLESELRKIKYENYGNNR